ncbi:MAG: hypothetical protein KGJ55_04870 [Gammaproteobacteria bacterium]|nr:hypothetical protein [Gammaproteobacteria bacterium]
MIEPPRDPMLPARPSRRCGRSVRGAINTLVLLLAVAVVTPALAAPPQRGPAQDRRGPPAGGPPTPGGPFEQQSPLPQPSVPGQPGPRLSIPPAPEAGGQPPRGGFYGLQPGPPPSRQPTAQAAPRPQPQRPSINPGEAARRAQAINGGGRVLTVTRSGDGYRVKLIKRGEVRVVFVPGG